MVIIERNIQENQKLILSFLQQCKSLMTSSSEIHLTVKRGQPYTSWNMTRLIRSVSGYKFTCTPFYTRLYPGYVHRRTIGYRDDISSDNNVDISKGALTYVITLYDRTAEEESKSKKKS